MDLLVNVNSNFACSGRHAVFTTRLDLQSLSPCQLQLENFNNGKNAREMGTTAQPLTLEAILGVQPDLSVKLNETDIN